MAVIEATDATFADEVLAASTPVLVDYWADWCSPCKQMAPIIDELAAQFDGQLKVVKVDTNANTGVATQYGVMSLPTLQFFVNGEIVKQMQGGKTKGALVKAINELL